MKHSAVGEGDEDGEFGPMMKASANANIDKMFSASLPAIGRSSRPESPIRITLLAVHYYYPDPCKDAGWETYSLAGALPDSHRRPTH